MLKAPRLPGSSSETVARPFVEVTTPKPRLSSSVAGAPAPRAPPPSQSSGRRAFFTSSAISSRTASEAIGRVARGAWMRVVPWAVERCTSTGISRLTGPVGAERAAETAAVSAPMAPFASHMRKTALETPRSISGWRGTSWIAARSRSANSRSTWVVMCRTGEPAVSASAWAPAALPAAVPVEVMQTPRPPVTRA